MADYVTAAQFKTHLDITISTHDTVIARAIAAATSDVTSWCGRDFTVAATGSREVKVGNPWKVQIPDCTVLTAVKTDDNDDGTFETTWASSDYVLEPADNISADGVPGWPYTEIRAVSSRVFPTTGRRPRLLELTGDFGWLAVPDEVEQATLMAATDRFRSKDAPFGVAGFGEFGPIRVRDNRMYQAMLTKYRVSARAALVA